MTYIACCVHDVPDLKTLAKMSIASLQQKPCCHHPIKSLNNSEVSKLSCSPHYSHSELDAPTENVQRACQRSLVSSMKYETARLNSFQNKWPLNFIKPSELAAVGLYYLGVGDQVQCAFCRGIISNWDENDVPLSEHLRHFPTCPFLLNCDVGNVPLTGSNGRQSWQMCHSAPENSSLVHSSRISKEMHPNGRIKYPIMAILDKRNETFHSWPKSHVIAPTELAESGFFFSGVADVATCFTCGGILGNWAEGDVAWTEHAKHFPHCTYVKCIKGSDFIKTVRQNSPPVYEDVTGCYIDQNEEIPHEMDIAGSSEPQSNVAELVTAIEDCSQIAGTQHMCKICMDDGARVAFLPCGHSLTCPTCAAKLSVCPLCRQKIDSVIRIFFD